MKSNTVRLLLKKLETIPRSAAETGIGEIGDCTPPSQGIRNHDSLLIPIVLS